ncbi:c-type cytochrome [Luminiphilus sp.]|nr:c-type cytochrome [Luminiphilus sp.]MDA9722443.1 c-type cytochrome [Luminiphilus sp.]
MFAAIILLVLVLGTVVFHFLSPWYFTPIASNWSSMDDTVTLTFVVTGLGFVLCNAFIAYCIIKFRNKEGRRAEYEPESVKMETWLTGLTTVGIAAMLAPGLLIWKDVVTPPDDAMQLEVLARQWNWSYRLPGEDGQLGAVAVSHTSEENPLGIDPSDPFGQVTYIWAEPKEPGSYDLLCEELCGVGHYAMRGRVIVDTEESYAAWLADQPTFAETQAELSTDLVAGQAGYAVCSSCHGVNAEGNKAMHAPRLAGMDSEYMKRQLRHFKRGVRGTHEDDTWGRTMAPMAMMLGDAAAINNVVSYIDTLSGQPEFDGNANTGLAAAVERYEPSASGDPSKSQALYESTCAQCHGELGQGVWTVNAPALTGLEDWYLASQIKNFRDGIRGRHADDLYGLQMGLVANTMTDDQAIEDMVAYISTLENPQQPVTLAQQN